MVWFLESEASNIGCLDLLGVGDKASKVWLSRLGASTVLELHEDLYTMKTRLPAQLFRVCYFGCLQEASKSVPVLFNGIAAVLVLTLTR